MTRRRIVFAAVPLSCWWATDCTSASNGLRRFLGVSWHGPTCRMIRARILSERTRCWTASDVIGAAGPNSDYAARKEGFLTLNLNLHLTLTHFVGCEGQIKIKRKITIKTGAVIRAPPRKGPDGFDRDDQPLAVDFFQGEFHFLNDEIPFIGKLHPGREINDGGLFVR